MAFILKRVVILNEQVGIIYVTEKLYDRHWMIYLTHWWFYILSGEISICWMMWTSLNALNFGNNNFIGSIPTSIGSLIRLSYLHLHNNKFSRKLPSSLKNCTELFIKKKKIVQSWRPLILLKMSLLEAYLHGLDIDFQAWWFSTFAQIISMDSFQKNFSL